MGQEARANQLCAIEQGDDDAAVTSCPPSKQASKPISWSWTRWREMIIVAEQRRAAEREREKRDGEGMGREAKQEEGRIEKCKEREEMTVMLAEPGPLSYSRGFQVS